MSSTPDLILPTAPLVFSDYDITHRVEVVSPDTSIVKDITVLLAGFTPLTDEFWVVNEDAWVAAGEDNWPSKEDYPLDGYTLIVDFKLADQNGIGMCLS
jgi:hypothetical protein